MTGLIGLVVAGSICLMIAGVSAVLWVAIKVLELLIWLTLMILALIRGDT